MSFMNWIIEELNDASSFFYSIYREVLDWVYPFWLASEFFYSLSRVFNSLAWDFYDFAVWVDDIASKIVTFLTEWEIIDLLEYWLDRANWAYDWVTDRWGEFTNAVNNWWLTIQPTVQGWIDITKQFLQDQINSLSSLIASLQSEISYLLDQLPSINEIIAWFSNWWSLVLAQIIAWGALTALQIQSLIDSAFTLRDDFWSGWQDWRDKVAEFFIDPEDWLYKAVDRIIERFW